MLIFFFFLLAGILMAVPLLVSGRWSPDREKLSPFECGFNPFKKARTCFSLRFFLVTILFLIFDLEVVVLMPLGLLLSEFDSPALFLCSGAITLILVWGLFNEWCQGALDWVN